VANSSPSTVLSKVLKPQNTQINLRLSAAKDQGFAAMRYNRFAVAR
jgi:hypothetical protein